MYANSPYTLMKAFEGDQAVRRLIAAGRTVAPLIAQEIETRGLDLPEISLACFAYILDRVDHAAAVRDLKPLIARTTDRPLGLFTNIATHLLREGAGLPTRPRELVYTRAEIEETVARL